jgi:hypothetical protein
MQIIISEKVEGSLLSLNEVALIRFDDDSKNAVVQENFCFPLSLQKLAKDDLKISVLALGNPVSLYHFLPPHLPTSPPPHLPPPTSHLPPPPRFTLKVPFTLTETSDGNVSVNVTPTSTDDLVFKISFRDEDNSEIKAPPVVIKVDPASLKFDFQAEGADEEREGGEQGKEKDSDSETSESSESDSEDGSEETRKISEDEKHSENEGKNSEGELSEKQKSPEDDGHGGYHSESPIPEKQENLAAEKNSEAKGTEGEVYEKNPEYKNSEVISEIESNIESNSSKAKEVASKGTEGDVSEKDSEPPKKKHNLQNSEMDPMQLQSPPVQKVQLQLVVSDESMDGMDKLATEKVKVVSSFDLHVRKLDLAPFGMGSIKGTSEGSSQENTSERSLGATDSESKLVSHVIPHDLCSGRSEFSLLPPSRSVLPDSSSSSPSSVSPLWPSRASFTLPRSSFLSFVSEKTRCTRST